MEINELKIFSHKINQQEDFYSNVLGFKCSRVTNAILEIHAGATRLILEKSTKEFFYHFAFLIPTGTLNAAIDYLEMNSIPLLPLNGEKVIQFSSGSAIYFYDKDGNIAEFIERPTLNYPSGSKFSIESIIKPTSRFVPAFAGKTRYPYARRTDKPPGRGISRMAGKIPAGL